jgi:glutamine amidotransferase
MTATTGPARRARRGVQATVLDYGVGNMHSLAKALAAAGAVVRLETEFARALDTELLVLPGVGAYTAAAARIAPDRTAIREALMGQTADAPAALCICLGMQLLFESSDEGPGAGLGVLRGRVTRLQARRVPHMGWNAVSEAGRPGDRLAVADAAVQRSGLTYAYYAHGYACRPMDARVVTARLRIDDDVVPTIVRWGAAVGVQFHPEKSGPEGLRFLEEIVAGASGKRRKEKGERGRGQRQTQTPVERAAP